MRRNLGYFIIYDTENLCLSLFNFIISCVSSNFIINFNSGYASLKIIHGIVIQCFYEIIYSKDAANKLIILFLQNDNLIAYSLKIAGGFEEHCDLDDFCFCLHL